MKMVVKSKGRNNFDVCFYGIPAELASELVIWRDYIRTWSDERGSHKLHMKADKNTVDLSEKIIMWSGEL